MTIQGAMKIVSSIEDHDLIRNVHSANKAFEGYSRMVADDLRSIYPDTDKVIDLEQSRIEKS
jgi:DNA polymerase III psi subunit